MMSYLCSLMWPFLESYWITCVYLFSLKKMESGVQRGIFIQKVKNELSIT